MTGFTIPTFGLAGPRLVRAAGRLAVWSLCVAAVACGGDKSADIDLTGLGGGGGGGSAAIRATVNGTAWSSNFIGTAMVQLGTTAGAASLVQVTGTQREGNNITQVIITLSRMGTFGVGTYPLDPAGQAGSTGYSGAGQYVVGTGSNIWSSNIRDGANSGSGTITFTMLTTTRVAGTFQFTAVPIASNTTTDRRPVSVTSGTFDVPVVGGR